MADAAAKSEAQHGSTDLLLTARELVQRLADDDVGEWTPEAPRQWLREDPPVPVAKPGRRGQPHRYRYDHVLTWLRRRDSAVRVKDFTPPPAADDAGGHQPADGSSHANGADAEWQPAAEVAQVPERVFSDPRLAKAHEEAQLARIKRRQLEGQLVDVEDLRPAWQRVVVSLRSGLLNSLPRKLDQVAESVPAGDQRVAAIKAEIESALREVHADVVPGL